MLRELGEPAVACGLLLAANAVVVVLFEAPVAIAVISAGEILYKPTATAHVADVAPAGMVARYQSLYGAASIGGMMLAPALGGFGYQHAGRLIWPVCGVMAGLSALVLWRVGGRPAAATVCA